MSEFKPIRTTSSNLSNVSVVDGQIILTTDTGACYIDFGSTRVQIGVAVNQGSGNSGKYLAVNSSGVVAPATLPTYTLPPADTSDLGGIKIDGTVTSLNSSYQLEIDKNALLAGTGYNSIAIGDTADGSHADDIAIGRWAQATGTQYDGGLADPAIAIGAQAIASGPGAIQLGPGINTSASLCIGFSSGDYELLGDDGIIPSGRLPLATSLDPGAVSIDGTTITIDSYGVISATDPLASIKLPANEGKYLTIDSVGAVVATDFSLPVASTSTIGGIKVDGTKLTIGASNVLQINKNALVSGTGSDSLCLGSSALASSQYSIAFGYQTEASSTEAIAIGFYAEASYSKALAIGSEAVAGSSNSSAIGAGAEVAANTSNSIQLGRGTNSTAYTFSVGCATGNYTLLDLSTGRIPSARIPGVGIDNAGKFLKINAQGELVAEALPVYAGEVE